VQRHEGGSIKHDVSVPVAAVPAFIARRRKPSPPDPGSRRCRSGISATGNIHYNVTQPADADKGRVPRALGRESNAAVFDVGATSTAARSPPSTASA
jgi:D-lactate dehydrogenase (cytochrome)